jgi:phage/plasmid primase-like uncharacterized protein
MIAPSMIQYHFEGAAMDIHSIARAKTVRIEDELARRSVFLKGSTERAGPCPICGGRDRFSINVKKQVWNCPDAGAALFVQEFLPHCQA